MYKIPLGLALCTATLLAAADTTQIAQQIKKEASYKIDGYFVHYGNGAFDWLYMTSSSKKAYKLEGIDPQTKYFIWTPLQGALTIQKNGEYINVITPNPTQILNATQPNQHIEANLAEVKTIKCDSLSVGDKFYINNKEYRVVNNTTLKAMNPATDDYVHICTSHVTNMSYLFQYAISFNQPIGQWDTSNVTTMVYTFDTATSFNQPIGNWDISSVTKTYGLFFHAVSFNQPLEHWDTSNVQNMGRTFFYAFSFNQPLANWNTSQVTNMAGMFYYAINFNQPIDMWNTSQVTNMASMFAHTSKFNQSLSSWNTSNVTDMRYMFQNARSFNQNIHNWCVEKISTKRIGFDVRAAFEGHDELHQPQWGSCPGK